jgi:hypothetical protein
LGKNILVSELCLLENRIFSKKHYFAHLYTKKKSDTYRDCKLTEFVKGFGQLSANWMMVYWAFCSEFFRESLHRHCSVGWVFLVWGNFKLIFLTSLSLKKLWWDVKSISAYLFFFLGLSGAPRPWRLKILIWRSKIEVAIYIDMVLFLVVNCLLIPKMYKFCCLEVNFQCYRVEISRNLKISYILTLFDLQTTKFVHFWNQRAICNQKKYHINI